MIVNNPDILTLEKEGFFYFFDRQIDHGQSAVHLFILVCYLVFGIIWVNGEILKFIIKYKLSNYYNYKFSILLCR
jgi:hypothetical protein